MSDTEGEPTHAPADAPPVGRTGNGNDRHAAGLDAPEAAAGSGSARDGGLATHMAEQVCRGFVCHDRREWEAAVAAFHAVDRHQFAHLDEGESREAARAYAAALWAKDAVEEPHVRPDGSFDLAGLEDADWGRVEAPLARRAEVVGMPREYATATVEGWREHKLGGDYWTPHMRAQRHEIRAALGDPEYPRKPGSGASGFGPLAARYLVGIELHDMKTERHWRRAVAAMTPYYEEILARRERD